MDSQVLETFFRNLGFFIMPKISEKAHLMPYSPIRKLSPFADQAKSKGITVYHLNIGQPDIETPVGMLAAVRDIRFKIWSYTPSEGIHSYRKKLSHYYQNLGYPTLEEDILVTTGGSEALYIAMNICLEPHEEVLIPEPFYANYNGFANMAGVKVKPVTSIIETAYALPNFETIEKAIGPKTKAIVICSPNNPTGYLYTREEIYALKDLVLRHDLFLIFDEAYRDFCYDGTAFFSPLQIPELENHVIMVDTVSKRYSACGARLGTFITKNKEVMDAALRFAQARLCSPQIAQIAAEAALDTPQEYFDKVRSEYEDRRDYLVKELNKLEGVKCPNPGGAFYVMPSLPVDDSDVFCRWLLEDFVHENQTLMLAPATGFYSDPLLGKNQVRIAYVLERKKLEKAMECLKLALEQYPGNTLKKK